MEKEKILVVSTEKLFQGNYFEGFAKKEIDFMERIMNNLEYKERNEIEFDSRYRQPIAYNIIINPDLKKVFAYQRAVNDADYSERRLQGKWSFGIGGHIKQEDGTENQTEQSRKREIEEELKKFSESDIIHTEHMGYINSNFDINSVHFGILYVIETSKEKINFRKEILQGEFKELNELESMCLSSSFSVEEWSKIALNPLKDYMKEKGYFSDSKEKL